jgi:hypothetical protein
MYPIILSIDGWLTAGGGDGEGGTSRRCGTDSSNLLFRLERDPESRACHQTLRRMVTLRHCDIVTLCNDSSIQRALRNGYIAQS